MAVELHVVRHGQTNLNAAERYLGALDPPLNAAGRDQARKLAGALAGRTGIVVASPLLRARQTADILAAAWDTDVVVCKDFAERKVGVYEGLTREEARLHHPDLWRQDITRRWAAGPPGGESIYAVFVRVAVGLQWLSTSFDGQRVTLVAHGFVAKTIRTLILGGTREAFFAYSLKNGETARYELPRVLPLHPDDIAAAFLREERCSTA